MSKKKQKTEQTNTYGYMTPSNTPDINAYRDTVNTAYDTPDPNIPFAFAQARDQANNRFDNPFGADYSPEVRDAAKYANNNSLDQAQGQALREDTFNRKIGKVGAQGALAGLTAPQLVQTGGNSTTTQSGGLAQQLIGAGASIGSAAIM